MKGLANNSKIPIAFRHIQTTMFTSHRIGSAGQETPPAEHFAPAVTVRKSLASKDHLISLIDGKSYKTLRRHLSTHGLSPEEYRQRYNLKADYPMVAENYSIARREMAKRIGLGRKPGQKPATRKPRTKSA